MRLHRMVILLLLGVNFKFLLLFNRFVSYLPCRPVESLSLLVHMFEPRFVFTTVGKDS